MPWRVILGFATLWLFLPSPALASRVRIGADTALIGTARGQKLRRPGLFGGTREHDLPDRGWRTFRIGWTKLATEGGETSSRTMSAGDTSRSAQPEGLVLRFDPSKSLVRIDLERYLPRAKHDLLTDTVGLGFEPRLEVVRLALPQFMDVLSKEGGYLARIERRTALAETMGMTLEPRPTANNFTLSVGNAGIVVQPMGSLMSVRARIKLTLGEVVTAENVWGHRELEFAYEEEP